MIGDRIKEVRENHLKLKQKEFADAIEVKPQQLSRYENGQTPGLDTLMKISKVFDISINWLVKGVEPIFLAEFRNFLLRKIDNAIAANSDDEFTYLPLKTQAGAATSGILDTFSYEHQKYAFRKEFIKRVAGGCSKSTLEKLFLVRIKGDSMLPTLVNEEIVLINSHTSQTFKNGAIYLVRDTIDQSTLAKRIYKTDSKLILHSDNPNYKDVEIQLDDSTSIDSIIIGRIVWGGRYYL